jgi:hypothetical protein
MLLSILLTLVTFAIFELLEHLADILQQQNDQCKQILDILYGRRT